jgi:glycine C-acetyltransferase
VVPQGQARIRVQLSAAHTREHLDKALNAFLEVGHELGTLKDRSAAQPEAGQVVTNTP